MPQGWEAQNWAEVHAARVAREITRLRGQRSTQWLSDRTEEIGQRVSRSVITDLENGRRKYVATHELVVLAEALSTSPASLLFGSDDGATVEYLPGESLQRLVAVQRLTGIDEHVLQHYEHAMNRLLSVAESTQKSAAELRQILKQSRDGG